MEFNNEITTQRELVNRYVAVIRKNVTDAEQAVADQQEKLDQAVAKRDEALAVMAQFDESRESATKAPPRETVSEEDDNGTTYGKTRKSKKS